MHKLARMARRSPLATYLLITFGFTWVLLPFARTSIPVSLAALFGPAIGAWITAMLCGDESRRDLRERTLRWRMPARWYAAAALLPVPISAFASGLEYLLGAHGAVGFQPISALSLLVFTLVIGEEIGWRGFALPRLLERFGPWSASVVLGLAWALWHLPLFFMTSMPQHGRPFSAFAIYTIALSALLTYFAQSTRGSVIIATLFHGVVNTFVVENTAASPALRGWGNAAAYGLAAMIIGVAAWRSRHL